MVARYSENKKKGKEKVTGERAEILETVDDNISMKISSRERGEKHTERKKKRELNRNKCVKVIDRVKIWREKKS